MFLISVIFFFIASEIYFSSVPTCLFIIFFCKVWRNSNVDSYNPGGIIYIYCFGHIASKSRYTYMSCVVQHLYKSFSSPFSHISKLLFLFRNVLLSFFKSFNILQMLFFFNFENQRWIMQKGSIIFWECCFFIELKNCQKIIKHLFSFPLTRSLDK